MKKIFWVFFLCGAVSTQSFGMMSKDNEAGVGSSLPRNGVAGEGRNEETRQVTATTSAAQPPRDQSSEEKIQAALQELNLSPRDLKSISSVLKQLDPETGQMIATLFVEIKKLPLETLIV